MAARAASVYSFSTILDRISHHFLGLADQIVVSATSFVAAAAVGRWAGASELGLYGTAISVVATLLGMQDGIVLYPYTLRRSGEGPAQERLPLLLSILFSSAILCLLALAASALTISSRKTDLIATAWVVSLVAPLALLKDLQRRFAFIELKITKALVLDVSTALTQIAIIAALVFYQHISASGACFALGSASLVSILPLGKRLRCSFNHGPIGFSSAVTQYWTLGKWVLLSRTILKFQGYCAMWLLVAFAGAATAGIYTACLGIVAFANPILFGIGNVLMPRSLAALRASGAAGLLRQVYFDALVIGCIMVAFTVVIALFGERLMALLYVGKEFSGQIHVLVLLALSAALTGLGFPATNALSVMEHPRAVALCAVPAIIITLLLSAVLIPQFGLLGAASSTLAGSAVSAAIRWFVLGYFLRLHANAALARRALNCVLAETDAANVKLRRIGDGDDAIAYLADFEKPTPQDAHDRLVVKLYKADADLDLAKIRAQRDALTNLYAALDNYRSGGWLMFVPVPVALCEQPTALVMTAMSGCHIDRWLVTRPGADEVVSVAQAFAEGLASVWRQGRHHGDLGFQNVLIEVPKRTMSFIDPGTDESCSVCCDRRYDPRTLDLSHFLYSYAADNTRQIGAARSVRKLKRLFVETVFKSVLQASSMEKGRALLGRVQDCAEVHVSATLTLSPTLRGAWRIYLRQRARHIIKQAVHDLRTNFEVGIDRR